MYPPLLLSTDLYKFPWFNIEFVNSRQLLPRLQYKYASSKLEFILFPLKFSIALQEKTSLYQIVILH